MAINDEHLTDYELARIEDMIREWHEKARAVLEWRTEENMKAAAQMDMVLAGWVTPLLEMVKALDAENAALQRELETYRGGSSTTPG